MLETERVGNYKRRGWSSYRVGPGISTLGLEGLFKGPEVIAMPGKEASLIKKVRHFVCSFRQASSRGFTNCAVDV